MASPFPHNSTSAASAKISSSLRWDAGGAVLSDDKNTPKSLAILITSALPPGSTVPHLGSIIGSSLSADVYTRYLWSRNRKSLYSRGTDGYEGGKSFKSRNIGGFGDRASAIGISPSVWRYYLLTSGSRINWRKIVLRNNLDLLGNFGNFVNRVLTFAAKKYDGVLPAIPDGFGLSEGPTPLAFSPRAPGQRAGKKGEDDGKEDVAAADKSAGAHDRTFPQIVSDFVSDVNSLLATYVSHMEAVKIRLGLATFMALSSRGNAFLTKAGLDNALFDNKRQQCDATILLAVNLIWVLATLSHPFMPETVDQINAQLAAPIRAVPEPSADSARSDIPARFAIDLLPGHKLGKPAYLFKRIDPKK